MKKILPVLLLALLSFPVIFYSCYYDNMEYLYPEISTNCDTTHITYSGTVAVIMQNNCLSCHSNSVASSFGGGIRLQDYADVSARIDRVIGAVRHLSGYSAMPKNGGSLDACSIRQLEIWVKAGKPNN